MSPLSVLLVDDDPSFRSALSSALIRKGYEVVSAASGEEAVEILEDRSFDWMVTDGRMDGMSGLDLSRQARELRPGLQILMVSGGYSEEDIAGYPILALLPKPVMAEEIIPLLKRHRRKPEPARHPGRP